MGKTILADTRLESYRSFFDHAWAKSILDVANGTKLDQMVFGLCLSWRSVANTHTMPWLLATMVQGAVDNNLHTSEPFGKKWVSAVREGLVRRMGDSLRHMQRKQLQHVLDELYTEIESIDTRSVTCGCDAMWEGFLEKSEFQFALLGSQRMCYGALYYAYEHFLVRCVGLAKSDHKYRLPRRREFEQHLTEVFGDDICRECWKDAQINLARVTRNALVHNGCRVTDDLKKMNHPFPVHDDELQIMAPDTSGLFNLLKDRALRVTEVAIQHPQIAG
jgi:hypothetical protein